MPAKNAIKSYLSNGIYHIYNRGINKDLIFKNEQDYKVFLTYLKEYLTPNENSEKFKVRNLQNYFGEIQLLAFCLMPNHIHLLIKQGDKNSIKKFTKSLFTRYSMYFNKKYKREGPLFQGKYKATNIINRDYLLDVSRYIHRNPIKISKNIIEYYSSYAYYLGLVELSWVNKDIVLDYFNDSSFMITNNIDSYKFFVEDFKYKTEDIDLTKEPETSTT